MLVVVVIEEGQEVLGVKVELKFLEVLIEFTGFGLSIFKGSYAEFSVEFLLKWSTQDYLGFQGEI